MSHYTRHIFFCTNQRANGEACCQDHGASEMRLYAKERAKELVPKSAGRMRVNSAGCMDRCEKGPVMVVYPEAVWYRYGGKADIDEIISEHLLNGRVVERLKI